MSFITITSADNQTIKQFSKLKQKKYREKEGRYITEGLRSSGEILKTDKDAVFVITERFLSDFSDFCDTLSSQKVYVVTDKIFNSLTDTESPQGILCVSTIKKASEKLQKPYYIYLDRLTDPGNVGTVIRTCHAFGFGGVLLAPGSCDVYSGKVIRSAMGSHLYTDIYTDFSYEALADLKKDGYKILLCHQPEHYDKYVRKYPIQLTLSGHAHGGQWRFFGRGVYAPGQGLFPKFTSGLYEGKLLVSRGLANPQKIPKIGNREELILLNFYSVQY